MTLFRKSRGAHSSSPLVEDAEAITAAESLPKYLDCTSLHVEIIESHFTENQRIGAHVRKAGLVVLSPSTGEEKVGPWGSLTTR